MARKEDIITQKTGHYVPCEYCGKIVYKTPYQYAAKKHHYCSNGCQALARKEKAFEHRKCDVCGADMYVSKKSKQRFCSASCQNLWQKTNTGLKNPKFRGGTVFCERCQKPYVVGKYKYESHQHHFCSAQCRQAWYADVWSQEEQWKQKSRERAVQILSNKLVDTQTKPQRIVNSMLDDFGIAYENEKAFDFYAVDNYLPEQNLVIEVMGDYWHCSPIRYATAKSDMQKRNIARDKAKHTYFRRQHGIEILYLWEEDVVNRPTLCQKLVQEYIANNGLLPNYHSFNYCLQDGDIHLSPQLIIPHQEAGQQASCVYTTKNP